jgi:hypothetical protein
MLYAAPLQDGFTRLAAQRLPLPLARSSPGLLVLSSAGVKETDPMQGQGLGAQAVLVLPPDGPEVILPGEWVKLDPWGWVMVTTDGKRMWVEVGKR